MVKWSHRAILMHKRPTRLRSTLRGRTLPATCNGHGSLLSSAWDAEHPLMCTPYTHTPAAGDTHESRTLSVV